MSAIPDIYLPPNGMPLYWRNEASGELVEAVRHYFDFCLGHCPDETAEDLGIAPLNERELQLLRDYCRHFINAPCWEFNMRGADDMMAELGQLRERAKTLASLESIRRFNSDCMELELDPF